MEEYMKVPWSSTLKLINFGKYIERSEAKTQEILNNLTIHIDKSLSVNLDEDYLNWVEKQVYDNKYNDSVYSLIHYCREFSGGILSRTIWEKLSSLLIYIEKEYANQVSDQKEVIKIIENIKDRIANVSRDLDRDWNKREIN